MAGAASCVWVGFIEALPVVGSSREAVEWVQAVAADDFALAEEKMQVITGRLGMLDDLKDNRSQSSLGISSASTSGSSTPRKTSVSRTTMEVEGIPEMNLLAHIIEVTKRKTGKKPNPKPGVTQADHQKKMQKVRDETLRKILLINQSYVFPKNEKLENTKSKRGEHVINNDVARIYNKVVDDFMNQHQISNILNMACPLDDATVTAIMYKLVAHFTDDELYINANAVVYGEYSRALKAALTGFLMEQSQESVNRVSYVVRHMNDEEAYVDHFAKEKWIGNQNAKKILFQTIREKVATMFNNWTEYFGIVTGKLIDLGLIKGLETDIYGFLQE